MSCIFLLMNFFFLLASTTISRRGRGRSKNISLTKLIKDTGQKLRIEIPKGLSRPVGKYAKQFKTEVGIICRTYAPLACSTWPTVKQEDRQIFYDRILVIQSSKFLFFAFILPTMLFESWMQN